MFAHLSLHGFPYIFSFQETELATNQTAAQHRTRPPLHHITEWIMMKSLNPSDKLLLIYKISVLIGMNYWPLVASFCFFLFFHILLTVIIWSTQWLYCSTYCLLLTVLGEIISITSYSLICLYEWWDLHFFSQVLILVTFFYLWHTFMILFQTTVRVQVTWCGVLS